MRTTWHVQDLRHVTGELAGKATRNGCGVAAFRSASEGHLHARTPVSAFGETRFLSIKGSHAAL